jgi:putrescine transport system ATP-binding protein
MAATGNSDTVIGGAGSDAGGPTTPTVLRFESISKRFGAFTALDNVSLEIRRGEFFALLGPSGCGKSTLLRLAAGFESPDAGRITLDGADLAGRPPHKRPVNMMFQNYALFPHMTVERNIAFGLRQDGVPRGEIAERVIEVLDLVQLQGLSGRKPHQLSGGQRQRVALARALVKRPRVLLLDEPLAALDKKLRQATQTELSTLQRRLGATFVIVTHDQEEAMALADRMAVMDRGRVVQVGSPAEIYEQPNSRYVATFIGDINLIEGTLARSENTIAQIDCGPAGVLRATPTPRIASGARVALALRPEKITLTHEPPADSSLNTLDGKIEDIAYLGDASVYKLVVADGLALKARAPNLTRRPDSRLVPGARVWLAFAADAAIVLDR